MGRISTEILLILLNPGDKWILNKWIRWGAQMFKYKCFLPKGDNFIYNAKIIAQKI